jgi:hypothetical protein
MKSENEPVNEQKIEPKPNNKKVYGICSNCKKSFSSKSGYNYHILKCKLKSEGENNANLYKDEFDQLLETKTSGEKPLPSQTITRGIAEKEENVREWDPQMLATRSDLESFMLTILGVRRSGKTTGILNILEECHYMWEQKDIFLWTSNSDNKKAFVKYGDLLPNHCFGPLNEEKSMAMLKRIFEVQNMLAEQEKPMRKLLLIFDDIVDENNAQRNPFLTKFVLDNRHLNCSIIIAVQRATYITPGIRDNSDIVMTFYNKSDDVMELIKKNYVKRHSKEFIYNLVDKHTQNYSALVIVTKDHEDYIYSWKPKKIEKEI